MISIEEEELERDKLMKAGKLKGGLDELAGKSKSIEEGEVQEERQKVGMQADGPSIPLWVFLKYTAALQTTFREINKRLISAFGVDSSNENMRLDWEQYVSLKCFFELFTTSQDQLEDIWMKALDPRGLAQVKIDDFKDFMEKIARGAMSEEPTHVSKSFSEEMLTMLK